eukprot:scaffold97863_cov36-Phaeocystis_antarctica.AAC.1
MRPLPSSGWRSARAALGRAPPRAWSIAWISALAGAERGLALPYLVRVSAVWVWDRVRVRVGVMVGVRFGLGLGLG